MISCFQELVVVKYDRGDSYMAYLIAVIILAVDQITKYIIRVNFDYGESIPIIEDIFHLTYVTNPGGAFGIFQDLTIFFIVSSVVIIVAFPFILKNIPELDSENILYKLSLGLIIGGAAGNLIDRVFFGYVIDFFDFQIWPVFNVADSAVVVGCFILFFMVWRAA